MRYALVNIEAGVVENVIVLEEDSDWAVPEGYSAIQNDEVNIGWLLKNGKLVAPAESPLNDEQMIIYSQGTLQSLQVMASNNITPLQYAVDLDTATAEERELLNKWKQYFVELSKVKSQATYPRVVEWPVIPE